MIRLGMIALDDSPGRWIVIKGEFLQRRNIFARRKYYPTQTTQVGYVSRRIIYDDIRIAGVIDESGPVSRMSRIHTVTRIAFILLRLANIDIKRIELSGFNVL